MGFIRMKSFFFFFRFFTAVFFIFCCCTCTCSSLSESEKVVVPAVYVFGDSLVDVGNNNYLSVSLAKANFPHNGIDYPTHKPTGRFSNGKNAADFLCEKLGLQSSPPPYLSLTSKPNKTNEFLAGVSFASGGAGIFNSTDLQFKQSIPLTKQVEYYRLVYKELVKEQGSAQVHAHLSRSIFSIVIGSNDIFGYFGSDPQLRKKSTPQEYVDQMAHSVQEHLKTLYSLGARKFVIAGLGPVGCCPGKRVENSTEACNEEANHWSQKYNDGLKSILQQLKSELREMHYSYLDTYIIFNNLIQHPAEHGLTEVKAACCGLGTLNAKVPCLPIATYCSNRKAFVFWDLYHPTEYVASIIANHCYDGSPEYAFPINLKELAAI